MPRRSSEAPKHPKHRKIRFDQKKGGQLRAMSAKEPEAGWMLDAQRLQVEQRIPENAIALFVEKRLQGEHFV